MRAPVLPGQPGSRGRISFMRFSASGTASCAISACSVVYIYRLSARQEDAR